MTKQARIDNRRLMALYYAYGRKDAGAVVDPDRFAEHYAQMYADVESGAAGFCPSVQDAFGYFVKHVAAVPV